ncbi:hypothetical protein HMPREF0043_02214, partial [Actinobaculum sp. oral taxon 183 str. F0552]
PARLRRAGRPAQRAAAAGNRPPAYRLMQGMTQNLCNISVLH